MHRHADTSVAQTWSQAVARGMQVSTIAAIDFTASNHDGNLHTTNWPNNPYYAGLGLLDAMTKDDSDGNVAVFGFGAQVGRQRGVQFAFPLNNDVNADVPRHAVRHIYTQRVTGSGVYPTLDFQGPTNFLPCLLIMENAARFAEQTNQQTSRIAEFVIAMFFTDGAITDFDATKRKIATMAQANLPISIIIVGVGHDDFRNMHALDADTVPLRTSAGNACRDIVQFVEMRTVDDVDRARERVLGELNRHFCSYRAHVPFQPHD